MQFNGVALAEFLRIQMMSKARLASKAGLAPSYITELIKGDKQNPSREVVKAIADALQINPRALYFESPAEVKGAA